MTDKTKAAEILRCREAYIKALREIGGLTVDSETTYIQLDEQSWFKMWQYAWNHNPAIEDNSELVAYNPPIKTDSINHKSAKEYAELSAGNSRYQPLRDLANAYLSLCALRSQPHVDISKIGALMLAKQINKEINATEKLEEIFVKNDLDTQPHVGDASKGNILTSGYLPNDVHQGFRDLEQKIIANATPPKKIQSEVVESVARALCTASGYKQDASPSFEGREFLWQDYIKKAESAIAAMPTQSRSDIDNSELIAKIEAMIDTNFYFTTQEHYKSIEKLWTIILECKKALKGHNV